jgi:integrase
MPAAQRDGRTLPAL